MDEKGITIGEEEELTMVAKPTVDRRETDRPEMVRMWTGREAADTMEVVIPIMKMKAMDIVDVAEMGEAI